MRRCGRLDLPRGQEVVRQFDRKSLSSARHNKNCFKSAFAQKIVRSAEVELKFDRRKKAASTLYRFGRNAKCRSRVEPEPCCLQASLSRTLIGNHQEASQLETPPFEIAASPAA